MVIFYYSTEKDLYLNGVYSFRPQHSLDLKEIFILYFFNEDMFSFVLMAGSHIYGVDI